MKRSIVSAAVIAMAVSLCLARVPLAVDVGTTSVKILPERGFSSPVGIVWTNGIALGPGSLVQNQGRMYLVEDTIASATDEPVHLSGVTNDFRYVSPSLRRAAYIQNMGATNLFLSIGSPAVANRGIYLAPGELLELPGVQEAVYGVAPAGTVTTGILDLP